MKVGSQQSLSRVLIEPQKSSNRFSAESHQGLNNLSRLSWQMFKGKAQKINQFFAVYLSIPQFGLC